MRRGFTLLELLLALALVGLLLLLAVPALRGLAAGAALRHESARLVAALDAGRGLALRSGGIAKVSLDDNDYRIETDASSLRWPGPIASGVRLTGASGPIVFGGAGLATGASNRTLVLTRDGVSRQVVISRLGRITRP